MSTDLKPVKGMSCRSQLPSEVFLARDLEARTMPARAHGKFSQHLRIIGHQVCLSRQGSPYTRLHLGDARGSITAIAWHDQFRPEELRFEHGQIVAVEGKLFVRNEQPLVNLRRTEILASESFSTSAIFPVEWVLPNFQGRLSELVGFLDEIHNRHVRSFLNEVFSDKANAMGLLNSPAGTKFHHAYQGGLLEHCVEMMVGLSRERLFSKPSLERDLAITLVMIHDLGKTITMVGNRFCPRGLHQSHEMATLELLAQPLRRLEQKLPVAANVLRGYFQPRDWFPQSKCRLYAVVSMIDRASAKGYLL